MIWRSGFTSHARSNHTVALLIELLSYSYPSASLSNQLAPHHSPISTCHVEWTRSLSLTPSLPFHVILIGSYFQSNRFTSQNCLLSLSLLWYFSFLSLYPSYYHHLHQNQRHTLPQAPFLSVALSFFYFSHARNRCHTTDTHIPPSISLSFGTFV